jgi:signal transduction histidine kinase/ligand-binding sensor domain-containing protein
MKLVASVLFPLLIVFDLPAQTCSFRRIDLPQELSPGSGASGILGIAQDAKGYMWFASNNGLYRYDGYTFARFSNNRLDSNSLGSNQLESICASKDGYIWIGTAGYGLDRFDPVAGKFMHFRHNPADPSSIIHNKITALLQDSEGNLWIGTHGGLDCLSAKTGRFIHYRHKIHDSNTISCDQVRSIYQDHQGTLWFGTGSPFPNDDSGPDEGGLNRLDEKTGKFTCYLHDPKDPHSLINNKVGAIFEDSRGVFWVGTAGDGLHTMDRDKGIFERHLYDPAHPDKLSRPPLPSPVSYDQIHFISEDARGYIWIGTILAGMNRYDPVTQRVTHCNDTKDQLGLPDNTAWCSFTSHEGVFWVGSWDGDLYSTDPLQKDISFTSARGGVNVLLDSVGVFKDHQGDLWIATENGLEHVNKKTNELMTFEHDDKNASSLSAGVTTTVTEDKNKVIWIGTQNGVDALDPQGKIFTHHRNNPEDTGSLSNNWVSALHEDVSGNLWVGCYKGGGINRLNRQTGKFKHYLLGITVSCLFEDNDGVLWAGTDGGFFRYNKSPDAFIVFDDPKKNVNTASINVYGITEDKSQNLWMSTSLGILSLNAGRNEINIYGRNRGVIASNLGFAVRDHNGKLYFGSNAGYYSFFPDSISTNRKPPQIVLANFRIGDELIRAGTKSPLTEDLNEARQIELNYKQNSFSFDFVSIHFSSPENNKHLFMLDNYDNTWRQSGTEHTAYYYNVPPGHYVLRTKAASSSGIWKEKMIAIIISPPWWRTWWAYSIYGALFLLGIYVIHRLQKQRVIRTERERATVKELAQAKEIEKAYHQLRTTQQQLVQSEKMASLGELTAGIAHEIQNPLNFVNNFSEVNRELIDELEGERSKVRGERNEELESAILKDIKDNEEKINHHGKRADAIVKGMLQHSRVSTGEKESTDINALVDEYVRLAHHGVRAKDKDFNAEVRTEFDDSIGKINIVPHDIGRVLLNLINNAFYAVNEKAKQQIAGYEPTVSIATRKTKNNLELRVADNGNGIPERLREKIFQPFFTTKPTGQGTGLGLSLAYDIVKAHGGQITVETEEGRGSSFTILLPVS